MPAMLAGIVLFEHLQQLAPGQVITVGHRSPLLHTDDEKVPRDTWLMTSVLAAASSRALRAAAPGSAPESVRRFPPACRAPRRRADSQARPARSRAPSAASDSVPTALR